jgi:hypothetical protein
MVTRQLLSAGDFRLLSNHFAVNLWLRESDRMRAHFKADMLNGCSLSLPPVPGISKGIASSQVSETKPVPQLSRLALPATIAQVSILIVGSLLPQNAKHAIGTQGLWHRPLHLILFATTACTTRAAFARRPFLTSIFLLTLALSLESAEHLLYDNLFEWRDVWDDAIGIAIGLVLAGAWRCWSVRAVSQ